MSSQETKFLHMTSHLTKTNQTLGNGSTIYTSKSFSDITNKIFFGIIYDFDFKKY